MTLISHLCFELSDVLGVQLECKDCHATFTIKREKRPQRSLNCPSCGMDLIPMQNGTTETPEFKALTALFNALNNLPLLSHSASSKFIVRLEFERPGLLP